MYIQYSLHNPFIVHTANPDSLLYNLSRIFIHVLRWHMKSLLTLSISEILTWCFYILLSVIPIKSLQFLVHLVHHT